MKRVLLVDDNQKYLRVTKVILEKRGYEVVTAQSCEDALKRVQGVRNRGFNIALIDLVMPDKDGIATMEELHKVFPELPVVIITAHRMKDARDKAIKAGAVEYMEKPISLDLLFDLCERFSSGSQGEKS